MLHFQAPTTYTLRFPLARFATPFNPDTLYKTAIMQPVSRVVRMYLCVYACMWTHAMWFVLVSGEAISWGEKKEWLYRIIEIPALASDRAPS